MCRLFLVKFCPNQLFTNTKADIGACTKIHDDFVKRAYEEKASKTERLRFEDEFVEFCQQTLQDVERRIKRARNRLNASREDRDRVEDNSAQGLIYNDETTAKMNSYTEQIETLLESIEEMGGEGRVEEAQETMKEVEKLKEMKAALKRDNMPTHWIQQRAEMGAAQEKQMEVCDVCGAFLIVNDVQQRVDDHLMGKQHVGYGKLKLALDEVLARRDTDQDHQSEKTDSSERGLVRNDSNGSRNENERRSHRRDDDRDRNRDRDRKDRRSPHRNHRHDRHHRQRSRSRSRDRSSRHESRRGSDDRNRSRHS